MAVVESSRTKPLPLSTASQLPELRTQVDELQESEDEEDEPPPRIEKSAAEIKKQLIDWIDDENIATHFDIAELQKLGDLVVREFGIDEESRAEWKDDADKALDFAVQKAVPKQYPWPDASNIVFPLITTAAIQFNARTYPAVIQNRNVVKGVIWGSDAGTPATAGGKQGGAPLLQNGQPVWLVAPGAKKMRAKKIGEHMSWQLLEEMPEWEEQTDQMLTQLPIVGGAVRKTFRCTTEDKNRSLLVSLMNMVWNFHAPSFEKAPRVTEIQDLYPHEIEQFERDGMFLEIVYGPGDAMNGQDQTDSEAPFQFLEQHRRYDLDGDGYAEPLIVTVHKASSQVVRIVARYEEDGIKTGKSGEIRRIEPVESYTLYRFLPNPKGGSYPVGFGHLLKPLNEAINSTLNQMFDAGHLQIAGGGFIGTSLSVPSGPNNFAIGEYKPVTTKGQSIRDAVFPIPWPGPSPVLFQLLGFLVNAAKETASTQDILTGDSSAANASPTTLLALVEQGMKVYTAIHKRVYRSLKGELAKLYRLNRIYLTEDQMYQVGDTWQEITPEDYRLGGGVEPIADPTMVTDMQRMARAALVAESAKNNPLVNPLEAQRRVFEAAQIDRISDLIPDKMPPPQQTLDQIRGQALLAKTQSDGSKMATDQALAQSKLGLERAQELQFYTQAMLNLQKAKSEATGPQLAYLETQLNVMRLHIEALNTTVKAADVDAKFRGHAVAEKGHNLAHHARMAQVANAAQQEAENEPNTGSEDASDGSAGAAQPVEPAGPVDDGGGIQPMAPSPDDQSVPPLPSA